MDRLAPKQAFAAREAHEALVKLKILVEEAANTTRAAELECCHVAMCDGEKSVTRTALQQVADRIRSGDFDAQLSQALEKLETAITV